MEEKKKKGKWDQTSLQTAIDKVLSKERASTSANPHVIQIVRTLSPLSDAAKKRSAARKRKCERSEILTSSPYKIAVEEKEKVKNAKEEKKIMRTNFKAAIEGKGKQTTGQKTKGKSGDKSKKKETSTKTPKIGTTTCVVCLEDNDEDWIQCSSCHGWAHEACADIPVCSDAHM